MKNENQTINEDARFLAVAHCISDALIVFDRQGQVIFWNASAESLLGYPAAEVLNQPVFRFIDLPLRLHPSQLERKLAEGGGDTAEPVELSLQNQAGEIFPAEIAISGWRMDGEAYFAAAIRDTRAQKSVETALREVRSRSQQILAAISSILIGVNMSDIVTHWNASAEKVFGAPASRVIGKPLVEAPVRWNWDTMLEKIGSFKERWQQTRLDDLVFTRPDGREGLLGVVLTPMTGEDGDALGYLLVGADITERRAMERRLSQEQKLQSIGQLAAGIAHEINTPIQYVGDNTRFVGESFNDISRLVQAYRRLLDLVEKGLLSQEALAELRTLEQKLDIAYLLEEIPLAINQSLEGTQRISQIVSAMKEFSHPGSVGKTMLDVNKAIESCITVARNEWKYVAEVNTFFEPELPKLYCQASEFNQAILNIIVNAAHAIQDVAAKEGGKGKITISTGQDGEWVEIRISDTGGGIPAAIQARIFDPFFTTKEVGRGTGQGLAITHDVIVSRHHGTISFETQPGQGTTFILRLPLIDPEK